MTPSVELRECSVFDAPLLSVLNKQLIYDEKSDNKMTLSELQDRMESLLLGSYIAYLFMLGDNVAGYALVNKGVSPYYLRQFFICREYRRRGLGRKAFKMLLDLLDVNHIDIDVLCHNEPGLEFWKSLGFSPRSIGMRFSCNNEKVFRDE